MCVTLAGIVTNVNVVQEANALSPIVVTFSGITILYKALQKENAHKKLKITACFSLSNLPKYHNSIFLRVLRYLFAICGDEYVRIITFIFSRAKQVTCFVVQVE